MSSPDEELSLIASLDLYKAQLSQVETCLQSDENGLNRDDLVQLQSDLHEIIQLTEQNIAAIQSKRTETLDGNFTAVTAVPLPGVSCAAEAESHLSQISSFRSSGNALCVEENTFDAEYAAFKKLLAGDMTNLEDKETADQIEDDTRDGDVIQIDSDEDSEEAIEICDTSSEDSADTEGDDMEEEDDVFGQKCQAPFSHSWGQSGYYNAIVLSRVKKLPEDSDPMVEVVFCYPTHCSMRLCPYYLSGNCRYEAARCRYSHGEAVKISELRSFEDPDFSYVAVGSPCLVRDDDDIWYEATIMEILDDAQFHIQFKANDYLKTVDVKDLFPLSYEPHEDAHSHNEDDDGEKADEAFASSFSAPAAPVDIKTTDALGQWEMHTKGIGSKLMAKMGYVTGQGLGRNNEGRADPVRIELLPKGLSLDKIMELKNLAANGNLFDVLKKQKRKQKQKNMNKKDSKSLTEGPNTKAPSVFDFINNKLRPTKGKHRNPSTVKDTKFISTRELKTKSDKHLNIQLMKTNEEINNTERQILRLKDSIQRSTDRGDHVSSKELTKKIDSLRNYTTQLKASEALMKSQKKSRKAHNLLTKF